MSGINFMEKLLDGVEMELKTIGEVFDLKNGYTPSKANTDYWTNGKVPWFRIEDIRVNGRVLGTAIQSVSASAVKGRLIPANSLIMSTTATLGEHALIKVPFLTNQQITSFTISSAYDGKIDVKFMFHCFFEFGKWCSENTNKSGGVGIIGLSKLKQFQVPIPCPENPEKSLEIQAEIVRILDSFTSHTAELTAELTARKKQYNYYRDQLLSFEEGEAEWKTLGEVYKFQYGMGNTIPTLGGEYPVYGSNGIVGTHNEFNSEDSPVIGHIGAYAGIVNWGAGKHFVTYNGVICKLINKHVHPKYAYYQLLKQDFNSMSKSASHPFVSYDALNKVSIPIPPPAEQERIVSILDKFDTLTNSITEGLPREIELRQKQYEYYRNLLLSFPKHEGIAA